MRIPVPGLVAASAPGLPAVKALVLAGCRAGVATGGVR